MRGTTDRDRTGPRERPHIVIVGGGFAGATTAKALERRLPQADIRLLSAENYLTYNPLLAEVVGASVLPGHVVAPLRQMVRRARVNQVEVTGIDTDARRVHYRGQGPGSFPYDHLVLACGSRVNLDLVAGMGEHALPLKTVGDALHLRNRMIARLEEADLATDPDLRQWLRTFVIVGGGGFSGVEVAGEISDFLKASRRWYPQGDVAPRVVIVHGGSHLMPELPERLGRFTERKLGQGGGVEIRLNTRSRAVDQRGVVLDDGSRIDAGTVVCTIGTRPNPLTEALAAEKVQGRIRTLGDMSVPGLPGVWSLGDCATVPNRRGPIARRAPPPRRCTSTSRHQPRASPFARGGHTQEISMSSSTHTRILAGLVRSAVLAVAVALLAGCGDPKPAFAPAADGTADGTPQAGGDSRKVLYWYDPMMPQQRFDKPGRSPFMDMDLVPKYADEEVGGGDSGHASVALSAAVVQNLGVRTAQVQRGTLARTVRAVGRVAYDETRLAHVHPRAAGWIERLAVRAEGEPVRKGQELAALYAPDILSAQVDFLIATEPQGPGERKVKADKARNLLRLLDVPEAVIRDIERSRETRNTVPVLAPADGIVTQLTAREGMYVTPGSEMFAIADLSRVWVLVDVFEHQLAWIAPGLPAQIQVTAYPGRTWKGRVDYLYPELDPKTRTLRVRLVFPNPDLELKPNLFADVTIQGVPREALHIPREALIATGERESVVKALGEGRFQPVDVVTGMRSGETVEILSGLGEGDTVVVSGQFLIDSESSLKASFGRLSDDVPTPTPDTGHQH